MMGISYSTARWLAPASFVYDFAAQSYGLLATPNMKDIHDANLSFFSPQPYFIALFFFPQQIAQVAWLYRLLRKPSPGSSSSSSSEKDVQEMVDYAPVYALGNFCIGTWMFFWNANDLRTSNAFVLANTVAQLGYLATRLPRLRTASAPSILTHVVAKTFAGIGVLDALHNSSAAYARGALAPGAAVEALTGVGFAAAAAALGDWIFGGCLVFDLVALAVGQAAYSPGGAWARLLAAYAVGTAAVVGVRNWLRPPYVGGNGDDYVLVPEEADERV